MACLDYFHIYFVGRTHCARTNYNNGCGSALGNKTITVVVGSVTYIWNKGRDWVGGGGYVIYEHPLINIILTYESIIFGYKYQQD